MRIVSNAVIQVMVVIIIHGQNDLFGLPDLTLPFDGQGILTPAATIGNGTCAIRYEISPESSPLSQLITSLQLDCDIMAGLHWLCLVSAEPAMAARYG